MSETKTFKEVEEEIDRLISDKEKSENKNIRKEIADLKTQIADYKQSQVDEAVADQIKKMLENNEISKAEYKQMIAESGDQD